MTARARDWAILGVAVAAAGLVVAAWLLDRSASWWLVGAAVWLALMVFVAVGVGKVVRRRDRQVPTEPDPMRTTGWGPFPMPGETRRMQRARDEVARAAEEQP